MLFLLEKHEIISVQKRSLFVEWPVLRIQAVCMD